MCIRDSEYAVYDDVGFNAHQGNFDNGVEGVEIVVYVWNEDEEMWYDHAYLETNETGEAWLYNEICGSYEWEVYTDGIDEKGYYEVWAGCDDTGSGGGGDDEDHDVQNIKLPPPNPSHSSAVTVPLLSLS